jgi:hypothetical protein
MDHEAREIDAALLAALLDATVDGIIVADEDGHIVRVNAAASAMFGYEPDELVGQSINILMPPEMARLHDGFMHNYLRTGHARVIGIGRNVQGQRKNGNVFPLNISVGRSDLRDRVLFISIMHELTGRKAIEAALERSQRMEALGRMAGGITHDFNNVLTVITGSLELVQKQLRNPKVRPLIEDALRSAETGAHLVQQLLSFARGRPTSLAVTDVNAVVDQMGEILRRIAGRAVHLKTCLQPDLPLAMTDTQQLEMAIVNLLTNARDATPKGGEIRIETATVDLQDPPMAAELGLSPELYVCLAISDTGCGMSAEDVEQAFEPFFSTKGVGKGSGLGLAMVDMFARRCGGVATIQSQLGHGTTARLLLPVARKAPAADSGQSRDPVSTDDRPLVQAMDDER